MNNYFYKKVIRPLLFLLPAETAHLMVLKILKMLTGCKKNRKPISHNATGYIVMGLNFPNRLGVAAGLDKNGEYIDALASMGFGFIEVGTVTPKPQPGNDKPRLFRFAKDEAIINRMGFNNLGVDQLLENIKQSNYSGILGINIGKNYFTPTEDAMNDYLICFEKVYQHADYVVCNISSPNTKGLRDLQNKEYFINLFTGLKKKQDELKNKYHKYVPLVVKIAPDLTDDEIRDIARNILECKIDGVIATNTTIDKSLSSQALEQYAGGLSGRPLFKKSNDVLKILAQELDGKIPIIGVGGIFSAQDSIDKLNCGASLIQVYSGLVFEGPSLIADILRSLN